MTTAGPGASVGQRGRERAVAIAGLVAVAGLAWVYLWAEAARMEAMPMGLMSMGDMATGGMPGQPWALPSLALTFLMWSVMMVAMMLPSAVPAVLLYGAMARSRDGETSPLPSVWLFAGGYVAVWCGFSLAATLLQAWLASAHLLDAMMQSASVTLSAGVLLAAGVYQWLPVKNVCLRRCRDPLQMFLFRWHRGRAGAWRMGAEHGAFCVGCCWALMLVLFAAGVMNLLWVALLAGLVLAEKLLPGGAWIGRAAGVGFAATGVWMVTAGA